MSWPRRVSNQPGVPDGSQLALALPVVGIFLSELLVFSGYVTVALGGHLLTLLVCTFGPLWFREEVPTFQAFALLPVFRLVNLGMPIYVPLTLFWFPFVYGPFLPATILVARTNEAVTLRAGWKTAVATLPAVVLASAALAEIEYSIVRPGALVPAATPANLALLGVVMVAFVGLVEELLFRGVLQQALQARLGPWSGIVLASGVFAVMHAGYGIVSEIGFAFGLGLLVGLVYHWTDSLATVTLFHGTLNVFLFGVIPLSGPLLAL